MRKLLMLFVGLCVFVSCSQLFAQDQSAPSGPPKRLQLVIEDVKPGKGGAHQKSEAAWLAAFKKANVPAYGIAMTAMTGRNEAWFMNVMGDNWAQFDSWGKQINGNAAVSAALDQAASADGELISGSRTYYLDYVPDLSYRPDFKLGEAKFFSVDIVRVRPGYGRDFADLRKAVNAAHEKANIDEHMLVYYAGTGAPGGTYYIFEPIKSIASLDDVDKWHADDSAYRKALGDDFAAKNREFAQKGLMSTESDMFAISPSMSWVSENTAKVDPAFWNPKPVMAKAKPKTTGATPAAKKESH